MAVPKKRTSKAKKKSRLAKWTGKARLKAQVALSIAKSILTKNSSSFVSSVSQTQI
jgi:ribosomal protein L32